MYKPTSQSISEAESRPLEFNPNERAAYIRKMLNDINAWISQGLSNEDVREKASDFIELYPELFKKIINGQDLTPVQNMLEMLDRMGEGRISQHQASVIVGKKLVDRYVTPQLKGV
jgi:hypothetical protein